jgi:ribosomal protein S18 acetylase RimI-like enzyme
LEIILVKGAGDTEGVNSFLEVARAAYKDDPVWVGASDNMFLQRLKVAENTGFWPFVALENGYPVARSAAILNPAARDIHEYLQGWLGFFEVIPGHSPAGLAILAGCEEKLRQEGARSVEAPKIDNMVLGLQTEGFHHPQTVFTNYNPPFYLKLFEARGFRISARMRTFLLHKGNALKQAVTRPGFTTRAFDTASLEREISVFHEIQRSLFSESRGWVPRSFDEDRELVKSFLPFIDSELVIIAEDSRGAPVGLLVCLPDIYQSFKGQAIDRARIISIGVLPGWERKGVGAMMASHLMTNLIKKGYTSVEASWITAENRPPQNLARRFNAAPGREFVLLEKTL